MGEDKVISQETRQLFDASQKGDLPTVNRLVKLPNVDINWHNKEKWGATALHVAIENGHHAVVVKLLDAGADVRVARTPDQDTPLHLACSHHREEDVDLLLKAGAKIRDQGKDRRSWDMVNDPNQFGNTPLHTAAMANDINLVRKLILNGADPSRASLDGSTPLHFACYCELPSDEVIACLIEHGSKIDAQDKYGSTPLFIASKKGQFSGVKILLEHQANIGIQDNNGFNPLDAAKNRDHKDIYDYLLNYQENHNSPQM